VKTVSLVLAREPVFRDTMRRGNCRRESVVGGGPGGAVVESLSLKDRIDGHGGGSRRFVRVRDRVVSADRRETVVWMRVCVQYRARHRTCSGKQGQSQFKTHRR
jgi:hypothetical protein